MKNLILTLCLVSSSAFALEPSSLNCNYYSQVEREKPCGTSGYVQHFGKRMCEKYLSAESKVNDNLKWWFPRVRLCLQEELKKMNKTSCDQISDDAFKSHLPCYVKTGFCYLNILDKIALVEASGLKDVLQPNSMTTALHIEAICKLVRPF